MLTVEDDEGAGAESGTGTVAARLRLSYSPLGKPVHGGSENTEGDGGVDEAGIVVFYEHVFYRFEEGKIRKVWSLVDLPKTAS